MARPFSPGAPPDKPHAALGTTPSGWRGVLRARAQALLKAWRLPMLWIAVLAELALLLIALVPQSVWTGLGYPSGPIPNTFAPLVAVTFYLLPLLTGILCQRWQRAILLATFPAWLDLGVFAAAAAKRIGPFYLAIDPHTVNTISTLELFGLLGLLGWLARGFLVKRPKQHVNLP